MKHLSCHDYDDMWRECICGMAVSLLDEVYHDTGESYLKISASDQKQAADSLLETMLKPGTTLLIGQVDGENAGFLGFKKKKNFFCRSPYQNIGYFIAAFTDPRFRRTGVMKYLTSEAEKRLKADNVSHVELDVLAANLNAVSTWKKMGYDIFRYQLRKDITI